MVRGMWSSGDDLFSTRLYGRMVDGSAAPVKWFLSVCPGGILRWGSDGGLAGTGVPTMAVELSYDAGEGDMLARLSGWWGSAGALSKV